MYIAVYDENKNHIANLDNVTYELTQRVYDPDSFTATGKTTDGINDAKYLILNDAAGNYLYSCFVDTITVEDNTRTIKGMDFKTLFDTEILIDYTQPGAFDGRLSAIFRKVASLVLDGPDAAVRKIAVELIIQEDDTDTAEVFGSLQGSYKITNAYTFLKGYLKYYEYNVTAAFNVATDKIEIRFERCADEISIGLSDFVYELQTTADAINKAVAVVQYKPETEKDEEGNELPAPPRPDNLATVYYYREKQNNIVQSDAYGAIDGRIYPVRGKIFEAEYLADAQFDAVNELANARYVDNIILDHNAIIDPIDLASLRLYTKVHIYYGGAFYKTLPVSEKTTTADADGINTKIKLGFKKILLTEILKK